MTWSAPLEIEMDRKSEDLKDKDVAKAMLQWVLHLHGECC